MKTWGSFWRRIITCETGALKNPPLAFGTFLQMKLTVQYIKQKTKKPPIRIFVDPEHMDPSMGDYSPTPNWHLKCTVIVVIYYVLSCPLPYCVFILNVTVNYAVLYLFYLNELDQWRTKCEGSAVFKGLFIILIFFFKAVSF